MKLTTFLEVGRRYSCCPSCGNGMIGGGSGALLVEDDRLIRSCRCGWVVVIVQKEKGERR